MLVVPRVAARSGAPARADGVRLDVQGLRAVAVLVVVADHAGLRHLAGGYVGVDVFFVLSGFLITGLLVREAERHGRIDLGAFYARRARRILPAATLVLVATVAVTVAQLSYQAAQRVTADAGWAAAFLANVRFATLGTDYFAEGLPPSPVQHYWSLAVEEQFYLVWPPLLVLLLVLARRRRPGPDAGAAGTAAAFPARAVAAVTGAVVVCSLAWSVAQTRTDATAAYFSSPGRAWELGVGALLAIALPRMPSPSVGLRRVLGAAGLAAVAVAVLGYDASTPFPGVAALLPVLGTAALLAAGAGGAVGVSRLLELRPMTWVGDLSYSIYLWHWPVLVLWTQRTGPERGPLETTALLLAVLLLSVASYHLVENPFRHGRWWRSRTRRGLVLWPAAVAVAAVAVLGGRELAAQRLEDRLRDSREYLALRTADQSVREELGHSLQLADDAAPVAFPLEDASAVEELARDLWNHAYSCWVPHDRSSARICPVGDVDADRTMVLLGDSHAGQWLPALDAVGQQLGYRVVPLVKYGCVPYDVPQLTGGLTHPYSECDAFRSWVLDTLPGLDADVVYVGSRSQPANMVAPAAERPAAWQTGVASFLGQLDGLVPDVRVLGDTSPLGFDPIDCLTDPRATMASCTADETLRVRTTNRLTAEAAAAVGARYLPVERLVCLDGRCPAFAGGRMVYANVDHLSVDWVRHVLPAFLRLDRPAR